MVQDVIALLIVLTAILFSLLLLVRSIFRLNKSNTDKSGCGFSDCRCREKGY